MNVEPKTSGIILLSSQLSLSPKSQLAYAQFTRDAEAHLCPFASKSFDVACNAV